MHLLKKKKKSPAPELQVNDPNFEGTDKFSCINLEKDGSFFISFCEENHVLVNQNALASQISFFLWTFKSNLKLKAEQTFLLFQLYLPPPQGNKSFLRSRVPRSKEKMFIKEKEKPRFIIHTLVVFHFIILGKKCLPKQDPKNRSHEGKCKHTQTYIQRAMFQNLGGTPLNQFFKMKLTETIHRGPSDGPYYYVKRYCLKRYSASLVIKKLQANIMKSSFHQINQISKQIKISYIILHLHLYINIYYTHICLLKSQEEAIWNHLNLKCTYH